MGKIYKYLLIITIFCFPLCVEAETNTEKNFDLEALTLTYDDLKEIMEDIQSLVEKANKEEEENVSATVRLSITEGENTINIKGWVDLSGIKEMPNVGRSMKFMYIYYDAPISSITINLSDSNRKVTIEGSDSTQVSALSSLIKEKFSSHTSLFGGERFRLFAALVLCLIAFLLLQTSFINGNSEGIRIRPLLGITGILVIISIFALPWDIGFPGLAIYSTSANFFERNAGVISFLGIVATIVIPLLIELFKNSNENNKAN